MAAVKLDDTRMEVSTTETKKHVYELDFLLEQRKRIIADANDYTAMRKKELDEIDVLIAEATVLGLKSANKSALPDEIS